MSETDAGKMWAYHVAGLPMIVGGRPARPPWVPDKISVPRLVSSDLPSFLPGSDMRIGPGVYTCECNPLGAVSVRLDDGRLLGLRPNEFVPLTWRRNEHRQEDNNAI